MAEAEMSTGGMSKRAILPAALAASSSGRPERRAKSAES
jgi:hypothetical protein